MKPVQTITLLGSTGSIGKNTLEVVRCHPGRFKVAGLAAGTNADMIRAQIREFGPKAVYLEDAAGLKDLRKTFGRKVRFFSKEDGLHELTRAADADVLIAATTGTTALRSVLDAIDAGRRVALANKEILVMAGAIVMGRLKRSRKATLVPIDSEHSAIFQCLEGRSPDQVRKLILTGTGGPLRSMSAERFSSLSGEEVVRHPKWNMGRKISVDSATLMNKGLEVIEALWLFGVPLDRIEVLIHPEAVIHSMVELLDGSILAQLGVTDMRLPIQYAMSYPERLASRPEAFLDLVGVGALTFFAPDTKKFPCLGIAYEAARRLGSAPCVLSSADEIAVKAFLDKKIRFTDIPDVLEKVMSKHRHVADPGLDEIRSVHEWTVEETERLCRAL